MKFRKLIAAFMAAMMIVFSMSVAFAEEDLGEQILDEDDIVENADVFQVMLYAMGDKDWKWASTWSDFSEYGLSYIENGDINTLLASKTENDQGIGRLGVKFGLKDDVVKAMDDDDEYIVKAQFAFASKEGDYEWYSDVSYFTFTKKNNSSKDDELLIEDFATFEDLAEVGDFEFAAVIETLDEMPEEVENAEMFGAQFFVMGDKTWNWQSVGSDFDKYGQILEFGDAEEMANTSQGEEDEGIAALGVQFYCKDDAKALIKQGATIKAKVVYSISSDNDYDFLSDVIEVEFKKGATEISMDLADILTYEDLAELGDIVFAAQIADIEIIMPEEEATPDNAEKDDNADKNASRTGDSTQVAVLSVLALISLGGVFAVKKAKR